MDFLEDAATRIPPRRKEAARKKWSIHSMRRLRSKPKPTPHHAPKQAAAKAETSGSKAGTVITTGFITDPGLTGYHLFSPHNADLQWPHAPGTDRNKTRAKPDTSAYEPSSRANALVRGYELAAQDLRAAGGAYELEQVQRLLYDVSRQAVEKRVSEGSLLAVPGPSNRRRYPTFQFTPNGLVAGIKEVQKALPTKNPWAILNFFVRPDDRLSGRKPIDVLKSGDVERVVMAARAMGHQGR